jgi:hypothetical protein
MARVKILELTKAIEQVFRAETFLKAEMISKAETFLPAATLRKTLTFLKQHTSLLRVEM